MYDIDVDTYREMDREEGRVRREGRVRDHSNGWYLEHQLVLPQKECPIVLRVMHDISGE